MVGTNITFFAMLLLGYLGMPRRYATYEIAGGIAPLNLIQLAHQAATVGAVVLLIGQIIFVWNFVQSWLEAPEVDDGDPWDLAETGQKTREFDWYDDKITTALTDGGDEEVATDGGSESDASGTSSELRSDGGEEDEDAELATDGGSEEADAGEN
jgi:cytochrome c oxidase subunit 1